MINSFTIILFLSLNSCFLEGFSEKFKSSPPSKNLEKCTGLGEDYRGNKFTTVTGKKCLSWRRFHRVTYPGMGVGRNRFCRNPTMNANGPYCIVKYGRDGKDNVEPCGIKCRPGFIIKEFDHICSNKLKTLQRSGSLRRCIKRCKRLKNCQLLSFNDTKNECVMCESGDEGQPNNGWKMYRYYDDKHKELCKLSEEANSDPALDTRRCESSEGFLSELECSVSCGESYKGKAKAFCEGPHKKRLFKVRHNCEPMCYVDKEIALGKNLNLTFCKSKENGLLLAKDCFPKCDRDSEEIEEPKAFCDVAGTVFRFEGECAVRRCYFDEKTITNPKIDFTKCFAKKENPLEEEECVIACAEEYEGEVKIKCGMSGIFKVIEECKKQRNEVPRDEDIEYDDEE